MTKIKNITTLLLGMLLGAVIYHNFFKSMTAPDNTSQPSKSSNEIVLTAAVPDSNEQVPIQKLQVSKTNSSITDKSPKLKILDNAKIVEADSYEELLKNVDPTTEALYQQLNSDFYNLFNFSDAKHYQLLVENGMPTPEELVYVQQSDTQDLIDQIRAIKISEDTSNNIRLKRQKLASLAFNKSINELVKEIQNYHDEYQLGDDLSKYENLDYTHAPAEVKQAMDNVTSLWGRAYGNLAVTHLARARFNEINIFNDSNTGEYEILAHIALAEKSVLTSNIFKNYSERHGDEGKSIYMGIKLAILLSD